MVGIQIRRCRATTATGGPCDATPMREQDWCFWHHPEHQKDATEARRLGGNRRKREGMVAGAYEFNGLRSVDDIRRLLEIAVVDALGLDNSIARVRALASLAVAAVKLLESGEFEERLEAIEAVLEPRRLAEGRRR